MKFHCIACLQTCERDHPVDLPRSDEKCSHEWEVVQGQFDSAGRFICTEAEPWNLEKHGKRAMHPDAVGQEGSGESE